MRATVQDGNRYRVILNGTNVSNVATEAVSILGWGYVRLRHTRRSTPPVSRHLRGTPRNMIRHRGRDVKRRMRSQPE